MPDSFLLIYIMGALICGLIIAVCVFFIIKAFRRAESIGMNKKILLDTARNSAVFSIVPSIPIVIGVGIIMHYLGLAVAWIRLSVIGALQYELIAMDQVFSRHPDAISASLVATAILVMTVAILSGPIFNAFFYKKYQKKLASIQQTNAKLMDTVTGSLLGGLLSGMLSAILVGAIFSIGTPVEAGEILVFGEVTLITLAASVVIMGICGVILFVFKQKWIESYALPMTILGAMTIAFFVIPAFVQ